MTRRELVAYLGFKTDDKPLKDIQNQLEGIKQKLEFLTAVEVIKGIYELTERFTKFAEELHVASEAAGLTVEEFQKLAFAASKSAVSQEELGTGLARLTRHLYDARRGSAEAIKAFTDVGITPTQIASFKTGSDAMLAISQRFTQFDDKVKKAALTTELFGRGGVHLVAFLNQGPGAIRALGVQAEKYGAILTEKQVDALVKVEQALTTLFAVFRAFGASIASYIAPNMEEAINQFLKFYEVNRKIIGINIKLWVDDAAYALGYLWGVVKTLGQQFLDFTSKHPILVKHIGESIVVIGSLVTALFTLGTALQIVKFVLSPFLDILKGAIWVFKLLALVIETNPLFLTIGAWTAAIALLAVGLHDLYTVVFGSGKWEDTWMSKVFAAAKGIGGLGSKALGFLSAFFPLSEEGNQNKTSKGAATNITGLQNLASLALIGSSPQFPGVTNNSGAQTNVNYSINAPISVTVPPNTHPDSIGDIITKAFHGEFHGILRGTANDIRTSVAQ